MTYRNNNAPYDVELREARERERVDQMFNKIRSKGLELTAADIWGGPMPSINNNQVTRTVLTENDIFAGLNADEAAAIRNSQALTEDDLVYSTESSIMDSGGRPIQRKQALTERAPQRQPMRGTTWSAKRLRAKLTNGEIVPVWKVTDSQSGIELPTNFRIEEVAERIASVLNENGNVNDPRVVSTTAAYNKRVKLLKEMRTAKQAASEGDLSAKKKLSLIKEEIASVDYKLGI